MCFDILHTLSPPPFQCVFLSYSFASLVRTASKMSQKNHESGHLCLLNFRRKAFNLSPLIFMSVVGCVGFSSCGAWASLLQGMWDLPRPGIKPMSPALQGRFLTTGRPGKPKKSVHWMVGYICTWVGVYSSSTQSHCVSAMCQCFIFLQELTVETTGWVESWKTTWRHPTETNS